MTRCQGYTYSFHPPGWWARERIKRAERCRPRARSMPKRRGCRRQFARGRTRSEAAWSGFAGLCRVDRRPRAPCSVTVDMWRRQRRRRRGKGSKVIYHLNDGTMKRLAETRFRPGSSWSGVVSFRVTVTTRVRTPVPKLYWTRCTVGYFPLWPGHSICVAARHSWRGQFPRGVNFFRRRLRKSGAAWGGMGNCARN